MRKDNGYLGLKLIALFFIFLCGLCFLGLIEGYEEHDWRNSIKWLTGFLFYLFLGTGLFFYKNTIRKIAVIYSFFLAFITSIILLLSGLFYDQGILSQLISHPKSFWFLALFLVFFIIIFFSIGIYMMRPKIKDIFKG